jgi:hypothetical protein
MDVILSSFGRKGTRAAIGRLCYLFFNVQIEGCNNTGGEYELEQTLYTPLLMKPREHKSSSLSTALSKVLMYSHVAKLSHF